MEKVITTYLGATTFHRSSEKGAANAHNKIAVKVSRGFS